MPELYFDRSCASSDSGCTSAYNESEGMSPATAPSVATDDQRWSEVVPPDAALTFAAVYDPDGQWMTFSGAELLSSTRHVSANMPSDDFDNDSQILAFDPSAIPASNDNTATMAFFRENFDTKTPIFERYKQTRARASSTCDGVDVYAGETSRAGGSRKSRPPRQWSLFNRLDEGPGFDPRTAFDGIPVSRSSRKEIPSARAERVKQKRSLGAQNGHRSDLTDDGAVLVNLNLVGLLHVCSRSAFSVSTSSTSNFVQVGIEEDDDDAVDDDIRDSWTAVEAPDRCPPLPSPQTRVLRKRRPSRPLPSTQALDRLGYSQTSLTPTTSTTTASSLGAQSGKGSLKRLTDRLGKLTPRSTKPDEGWVCVDVVPAVAVTQRFVRESVAS